MRTIVGFHLDEVGDWVAESRVCTANTSVISRRFGSAPGS